MRMGNDEWHTGQCQGVGLAERTRGKARADEKCGGELKRQRVYDVQCLHTANEHGE